MKTFRRSRTSHNNKENEREQLAQGVVTEALPNALFRVSLEIGGGISGESRESGSEILAYLAGNMRLHRIRVLIGDKVVVKLDPYGGKGRITKRM